MHLRGGTKCYWLKWDNDWSGGGVNRPVNPMHLREDTSCFSLKWKNHWWGLEHEQFDEELMVVTNCTDFAGTSCFVTVAIVYWFQTREGSKMMCYYTSIIFRT